MSRIKLSHPPTVSLNTRKARPTPRKSEPLTLKTDDTAIIDPLFLREREEERNRETRLAKYGVFEAAK